MHILHIDICADYDYFSDMIYNPMKILPTKSIKFKKEGKDPQNGKSLCDRAR